MAQWRCAAGLPKICQPSARGGIYRRTIDQPWQRVDCCPELGLNDNVALLAVNPPSTRAYFAFSDEDGKVHVMRSDSGGLTWQEVNRMVPVGDGDDVHLGVGTDAATGGDTLI